MVKSYMTKSLLNYPLFYPVGTWQLAGSFLYDLLLAAEEILKLKSTRAKRRDLACQIYGVSRTGAATVYVHPLDLIMSITTPYNPSFFLLSCIS